MKGGAGGGNFCVFAFLYPRTIAGEKWGVVCFVECLFLSCLIVRCIDGGMRRGEGGVEAG